MWRMVVMLAVAAAMAGCRRVPSRPPPPPPVPAAGTIPLALGADAGTVGGALARLDVALEEMSLRLARCEAAASRVTDGGVLQGPPGPTGPIGPPGATGATGAAGPPGPPVRLTSAPDKDEVYQRHTEQHLERGESGAAVVRCRKARDLVVSGSCSASPAPLAVVTGAGAQSLDDPEVPAGWRCAYHNRGQRRAVTIRATVYCVAKRPRGSRRTAAPPPAPAPAPHRESGPPRAQ